MLAVTCLKLPCALFSTPVRSTSNPAAVCACCNARHTCADEEWNTSVALPPGLRIRCVSARDRVSRRWYSGKPLFWLGLMMASSVRWV